MKPYAVIVNPKAGRKKGLRVAALLEQVLKEKNIPYHRYDTRFIGDGENVAASLTTSDYSRLLVVGGDGTLNEVVRGLKDSTSVPLALFPAGTGNDVARLLGLLEVKKSMEAALTGVPESIDLGMADGTPFVNIFSFGLDAAIATQANQWKEKLPGWTLYLAALVKTVFSFKAMNISLDLVMEDGSHVQRQERLMLLAVCNGSHYGGGMNINPKGDPRDGLLELCLVRDMPWWKIYALFPTVYKGTHLRFREVSLERVTRVSVKAETPTLMNRDGETWMGQEATIQVVPQGLQVMKLPEKPL